MNIKQLIEKLNNVHDNIENTLNEEPIKTIHKILIAHNDELSELIYELEDEGLTQ